MHGKSKSKNHNIYDVDSVLFPTDPNTNLGNWQKANKNKRNTSIPIVFGG